ncbi:phytanoyl-CoA dioxygenase family protein [Sphingomonas sp. ID0503]|uniref:phytanoyl-CoA dioxygenase family protein n=1 Tax=Sphingomonas sp. ID0503 TaxID=3399691 RepID=UPI003AFA023E
MNARALLYPLYAAQLATGAKSFRDNPLIGSPALNRRGLHTRRVALAHNLAGWRRSHLAHLLSPEDRAAFDRDGFVEKRDFLPPALFSTLRDAVLARRAPARDMVQGDTITRRFAVDPAYIRDVPALRAPLADPVWRGLIRYAGSFDQEPLVYVQSILSHVRDAEPDPQTAFHADTFHPTVKAWLFLTDVAEDEGPFTYVPGSHRLTPARLAWEQAMSLKAPGGVDRLSARGSFRIAESDLPSLGLSAPRAFAVPANTLVVGDTFGFHARGPSVRPSTRVEIWAYGRRNPFLPFAGLDPLSTAGLAERRIGWNWAWRDWLHARGWKGHPWRDVGPKTPAER